MEIITTTPKRVREAAEQSTTVRWMLKSLYPEAFKEEEPKFAIGDRVQGDSGSIYIVTDVFGSLTIGVTCLVAYGCVTSFAAQAGRQYRIPITGLKPYSEKV